MYGNEKPGLVTTLVAVFGAALIGAVAAMTLTGPVSGLQPVNQFAGPGSTANAYLPVPMVVMTVIGAAIGAMVSGAIAQIAIGQGLGETDLATALYAVPGAVLGLAVVYAIGVRSGVEAEHI